MATDNATEEIRKRGDIVEIVEGYVALTPAGNGRWKACCPFHDEKTPSFYVSRDKGFYKCFGCGVSGDIFKFVQQIENLPFPEARRKLAERYGIALQGPRTDYTPEQQAAFAERDRLLRVTSAAASWFREQFTGNLGMDARDYARTRRLAPATLESFGIGYAPDAWDACTQFLTRKFGFSAEDGNGAGLLIEKENEDGGKRFYDRYRHRLMFPIWDERGQVIAFGGRALEGGRTGTPEAKYINSPEGPLYSKSRTLYAWHLARPEIARRDGVLITEGYMDAIALHAAGFPHTIATLGTSLTQQHVQLLKRAAPKTVWLCFDGDGAGIKAALRAGPLFDAHGLTVKVVALPDKHDPDTYIQAHGAAGFERELARAKLLGQFRVESAIGEFRFDTIAERAEALQSAANAIAEAVNPAEQEAYIAYLADKWARQEKVTDASRLQMIEAAVRRAVITAGRELNTQNRNTQRREWERKNFASRAGTSNASGEVLPLRPNDASKTTIDPNHALSDAAHESAVQELNGDVQTPTETTPRAPSQRSNWKSDEEWKEQRKRNWEKWKKGESEALHNAGGDDIEEVVSQALSGVVSGQLSGAAKAERLLLGVMLNAPSQRARIILALPPSRWTHETHFEIVNYLRNLPPDEPVNPPQMLDELPPEAGGLAGDLMLNDEAQSPASPDVIDDCIARIEGFHARQREREILEVIKGKLERGEPISPQEMQDFRQATLDTKRRTPPEPDEVPVARAH